VQTEGQRETAPVFPISPLVIVLGVFVQITPTLLGSPELRYGMFPRHGTALFVCTIGKYGGYYDPRGIASNAPAIASLPRGCQGPGGLRSGHHSTPNRMIPSRISWQVLIGGPCRFFFAGPGPRFPRRSFARYTQSFRPTTSGKPTTRGLPDRCHRR
jgi:hypothetical protein